MKPLCSSTLVLIWLVGLAAIRDKSVWAVDFDHDVLPILSDNCFQCHGPDEKVREASLRLDTKDGALARPGYEAIIIPGQSSASELIRRIRSDDPSEVMPPNDRKRLSRSQVETLAAWVDEGAAWETHWAWTPPKRPAVPDQHQATWPRNQIDHFVLSKLQAAGSQPSPPADRITLLRRASFDLTGLPPTLEEVDAFLQDESDQAWEKVVDRLLQSPAYGERMAWDWLDAARYSDTNGFQGDPERTMWPWRDWVVKAFQDNKPYDQFTIEQLAGDLIPQATQAQVVATGFNRNHMHNGEGGRIADETRVENVFDRVETTATVWLGATFTCCRCHDHKYDPFTLRDYFGLYDIFNQNADSGGGRRGQDAPVIDWATTAEGEAIERAQQRHDELAMLVASAEESTHDASLFTKAPAKRTVGELDEGIKKLAADPSPKLDYVELLKQLQTARRSLDQARDGITRVMVMEQIDQLRDTYVLEKGTYNKPTDMLVVGRFPEVLTAAKVAGTEADSCADASSSTTRKNRLDLARWLVAAENPLTARVTVNRFWQSLFGVGLVKTVEDFGVQGDKPSHPELLDWLAVEFMESGWDVKSLLKQITLSATYQQSSQMTNQSLEADPENRLLSRGPRYRLPSWMMRDMALFTSGLMSDKPGGPSVKPYQPAGIWEDATFGKIQYRQDHGEALYRRSLYIFWRRIVAPTMFFDNASRQTCTVKLLRTNTPMHALTTLNDVTWIEAARHVAQLGMEFDGTSTEKQIEHAFRRVTSRYPTDDERLILSNRLDQLRDEYRQHPDQAELLLEVGESERNTSLDAVDHAAMTVLCHLMLNLDEAISKE